jgi:hypothetical protein
VVDRAYAMNERSMWDPDDDQGQAITELIQAGAMRLCPRCQYVPEDHEETIFEPLGIASRTVRRWLPDEDSWGSVTVSVFTLVCAHCGYLIEHCLDYLASQTCSTAWEESLHVGLGCDPDYDILSQAAKICFPDVD